VSDLATLRLTWEPRMLSILRMMVGLLYMEHGLAKVLNFPHQPNHAAYALFTLNARASKAYWSWWAVCCSRWVCSPAASPLSSRATWRSPISWRTRREASSRAREA
jgi:hypothetical protein